jgi:hypothetical protein
MVLVKLMASVPTLELPAVLFYSRKLKSRTKACREALILLGLSRHFVALAHKTPKKPLKRLHGMPIAPYGQIPQAGVGAASAPARRSGIGTGWAWEVATGVAWEAVGSR